jgi:gliding motility-associated-like protein
MKAFSCKVRVLLVFVLSLFSSLGFSQVDKDFWFSIPYANKNHGNNYDAGNGISFGGSQPLYLRMTSLDNPVSIHVFTPRNLSFLDTTITIGANSSAFINLTPYRDKLEVSQTISTILNGPEDKGIHIVSTDLISAYFENATILNPEIFTLKGKNANGTEFYTPFQTNWPNDLLHNYQKQKLSVTDWSSYTRANPDSAFSAFDIVSTEDNNRVTITPTTDVVGHKKGETFTIVMQKGQTYSVRAISQGILSYANPIPDANDPTVVYYQTVNSNKIDENLSGSHVTSDQPIAIMVKDDSVFPNDVVGSGQCEDYVGDQIVPVTVIGKKYIVMNGNLNKVTAQGTLTDWVFLVAVKDGTTLKIDGVQQAFSLAKGETFPYQIQSQFVYIEASDSIYAFHISGYNCEFASAILPPINNCTGSDQVGFTRTYGTFAQEKFFANVLVRTGGEKSFTSDKDNIIANIINAKTFVQIPGSAWSAAQFEFTSAQLSVGPHILKNSSTYFHFSMINSTVFSWTKASTWSDATAVINDRPRLMGSSYGYFSSYNVVEPKAIIGNNNQKHIQVPQNVTVQLIAQGGFQYNWTAAKDVAGTWVDLTTPTNLYLNKVVGYNPIFDGTAPIGQYRYVADIWPACANEYRDTVYIEVLPPIAFHDVTDSICEDTPGSALGVGYNLNNLNDTIIGGKGKSLGYTVSDWLIYKRAGAQILDNVDNTRTLTYGTPTNGTFTSSVSNTSLVAPNTSALAMLFQKTNQPTSSLPITLATPISLDQGSQFTLNARPMFPSGLEWLNGQAPLAVRLELSNGAKTISVSNTFTTANWNANTWQAMTFDFSANVDATQYTKMTLYFERASWYWNMNVQFDDITWMAQSHYEKITNPTNITIHDNDTVYAHITNPQFPFFSDTAQAIIGVHPTGKAAIDIPAITMCATKGSVKECVDLTQYKYAVGGALVAQKDWYLDAALTQKVATPTCVNISGNMKYYAKIKDSCSHVGSVSFNITAVPTTSDSTVTLCADPTAGGNSATGVKLDNYINYVLPLGGTPTIKWYTDAALTSEVSGISAITVSNNQTIYANIYYNIDCAKPVKLKFIITPVATIAITANDLCINGGNQTLSAIPVGGTFTGIGVTGFTFNPVTAGVGKHAVTYTYTLNGCTSIKNDTIEVFGAPTANPTASPISPIDFNTTTVLNAGATGGSPNYAYQWSPAAQLSNSKIANPTTTNLTVAQQYCVTVTDKNLCYDENCTTVLVKDAPLTVSIIPSATNICLGNTEKLTSIANGGTPGYTYSWSSSPAGLSSTAANPSDIPTATGTVSYYVTVTDSKGATATNSTVITVSGNPDVTFPKPIVNVCQNTPLTLAPTITGDDATASYTWVGSPVALAPLNGKTVAIDVTQNPGLYRVLLTVINGTGGCKDTASVSVKINPNPSVTVTDIPGACLGIGIKLKAIPVVNNNISYTGLWTGNFIPGDLVNPTDAEPTFKSGTFAVYNFTYTLTDANGCTASATMKPFDLNSLPEPNILNAYKDSVCQNTNSYLLKSEILNAKYALNTYKYKWTGIEGSKAFTDSVQNPILNIAQSKTFNLKLQLTDKNGCSAYDSTILRVNPLPTAQIVGDASVCEGVNLPLYSVIQSTGNTYTWTGNVTPKNTSSVVFNGATSSTYNVSLEVKDKVTGCLATDIRTISVKAKPTVSLKDTAICYKSSVILYPNVSAGVSYTWTIDTVTLNSTVIENPKFYAAENRNYKLGLKVTKNGCSDSTIMNVTVNPLPSIDAGQDTNVLYAMPFTLNGTSSGKAPLYYQWTPTSFITSASTILKPTASIQEFQKFFVTVTDGNGCKAVDSVNVNVPNGKPAVHFEPQRICGTQMVTLTASAIGGTGNGLQTFTWYTVGGTIPLGTGATLTVSVSQQTDFRVVMVDATYPPVSDTERVSFNTPPTINITPPTLTVCIGDILALTASSPQANVGFTWQDGLITTKTNPFIFSKSTVPGPTDIFVIGTDTLTKCPTQKKLTITVNPLPTVSVTPSNPTLCAGSSVLLQATATPSTVSYSWTQTPSTTVVGTADSYSFSRALAGPYAMQVQVMNTITGCKATASASITVNALPDFKLPSEIIACTNQSVVLDVNPNNAPGTLNVSWSGDTQYLVDKTDLTAPIFKTSVANPAGYKLVYTIDDTKGCPRTDSVLVKVQPAPVVTLRDTVICQKETVKLQAIILGVSSTVTWDGFVTVDPNNKSVANFSANVIPGTYVVKVTASSNSSCKTDATANVTVHQNPLPIIDFAYANIPKGGQVDLIGHADPNKGTPAYLGQWLTSDLVESTVAGTFGFSAKSIALVGKTNHFGLVAIDSYGCKDTTWTNVTVNNGIDVITPGDSINKPNDPAHPVDTTTYPPHSLNYRHMAHICLGQSYTILTQILSAGSGDYTYNWTTNNTTFTSHNANIVVTPPTAGTTVYKLQLVDNKYPTAIIEAQYFTLTVHSLPDVQIVPDTNGAIYETNEVFLNARKTLYNGATVRSQLWSGSRISPLDQSYTKFTPVVKGDYSFKYSLTDSYGCVGTASAQLHVLPMGTIDLTIPSYVCGNGIVQMYDILNTDNSLYYWTISDPSIKISGKNPGKTIGITWNKPGTYTITVTSYPGNGTGVSIPKPDRVYTVTVLPSVEDIASNTDIIEGPKNVCEYDRVNYSLKPSIVDLSVTKVQWSVASDNKKIVGCFDCGKTTVQWGQWDSIWYHDIVNVTISDMYKACPDVVIPYPVTIHKIPTANFVARPLDSATVKEIYSSKIVDFDNRSYTYHYTEIDNVNKNLLYYWDFVGDGVYVQDTYEPHYSYDEKGVYNTSLIAVDPAWGCRDTITKQVVVIENPNCAIKYPNAFTPEAKADNKFTYGYSEGLVDKDYNLKIFNRWGQLLWETNSRSDKWDGTYKGEVCKQDVYVFHSTATCENGKVLKTNGDVTLIK